jgi:hypothetical protein
LEACPQQKHELLSEKITNAKTIGGVTQVTEHLLSKCEVLTSNPSTPQKYKEREELNMLKRDSF